MIAGVRAALAGAATFALAGAAPDDTPLREGDTFYRCNVKLAFASPGARPQLAHFEHGRTIVSPAPVSMREEADGEVQVDGRGRLTNLSIGWLQLGGLGWPQIWRADLDDIILSTRIFATNGQSIASFDPADADFEFSVRSRKRIRGPRIFELHRIGEDGRLGLGGVANVPAWRRSAELSVAWRDLERFAQGHTLLAFKLLVPAFGRSGPDNKVVQSGTIDMAILPKVLEALAATHRALLAKAASPQDQCTAVIYHEPEPNPLAEI